MTTMKNILLPAAVALVVAGALVVFTHTEPSAILGSQAIQVTDGDRCFFLNGQHDCVTTKALALATTTQCAIMSPNATSTLLFSSAQVNTASSTATTWTPAKATTAFATTTILGAGAFSLGSGARGTMVIVATSTNSADTGWQFAPNTWVVWGVAGPQALTSDKLIGTCAAEFVY